MATDSENDSVRRHNKTACAHIWAYVFNTSGHVTGDGMW